MRHVLLTLLNIVVIGAYGAGLWWVARQVPWWGAALIAPALVFLYFFGNGLRDEWRKLRARRSDPVYQLAQAIVLAALRGRGL